MGWYLYLVGSGFVALAVILRTARPHNLLHSRDISGAVVVGDVAGTVTQTVSPIAASKPASTSPDRVAWVIGIIGILVALAQLVHDFFK